MDDRAVTQARSTDDVDVLLAGGTVVDGSAEAQPRVQDVAIRDDTVVGIGDLRLTHARRRIDVNGCIVAPGFIDPHTHNEVALTTDTLDAHAAAAQGVTTCLTSPDGFGWAPLTPAQARDLWAATAGIYGPWPDLPTTSIETYLRRFNGETEVNVLPQIPLAAVRYAALGWSDGTASRRAIAHMEGLVSDWLDAGAAGLAIGLEYEPGARASTAELMRLCEVVSTRGGSLAAHIRYLDAGREAAWREVAEIGRATGVTVNIAHEFLDAAGSRLLAESDPMSRPAVETYLYPATSTNLATYVERSDRIGGPVAIGIRLDDADAFARVERAVHGTLGDDLRGGVRAVFAHSSVPARIGRDLRALAAERSVTATQLATEVLRDDPDALFVFRRRENAAWIGNAQATIQSEAMIVASDGIYRQGQMHPRGYGTFPRALRLATREWQTLDLAGAIHLMTGRTAARYRVPNRGILRPGAAADVVVFDPKTVAERATFTSPKRLPIGIRHVFVNGVAVVDEGRATAARPGRVLAAA